MTKSAKATMADRALALAALHTARGEVAGKRSKLHKLRGTPGIRVRTAEASTGDCCPQSPSAASMQITLHAAPFGVTWLFKTPSACLVSTFLQIPVTPIACRQEPKEREARSEALHTVLRRHSTGRCCTGCSRCVGESTHGT